MYRGITGSIEVIATEGREVELSVKDGDNRIVVYLSRRQLESLQRDLALAWDECTVWGNVPVLRNVNGDLPADEVKRIKERLEMQP